MKKAIRRFLRPLTHLLPSGIPIPVLTGPLKGRKWIVGAAAGTGKGMSIFFNQFEPAQVKYAIQLLKTSSLCYDIGANVGFYTLLFSLYAEEVLAFEPLPRNLYYLIRLLELNKVTNTTIMPCAVSETAKISNFAKNEDYGLGKLDKEGDLQVLVTTCDQVVKETKKVPDLLKIDVEGAELGVLKGAKNLLESCHPSILLSVHSDQLRLGCLNYLKDMNYNNIIPINSEKNNDATEFAAIDKKIGF